MKRLILLFCVLFFSTVLYVTAQEKENVTNQIKLYEFAIARSNHAGTAMMVKDGVKTLLKHKGQKFKYLDIDVTLTCMQEKGYEFMYADEQFSKIIFRKPIIKSKSKSK